MNRRALGSRLAVAATIVALQVASLPVVAAPDLSASLSGRILSSDAHRPVRGVVVRVHDPVTGDLYTSSPTDDKGAFAIDTLPPATYNLAVQAAEGLFAAGTPVVLAPGQDRSVQVAVYANDGAPPRGGEDDDDYKAGPWENPFTATLIVLGIAVVIGVIVDELDDDDDDDRDFVSQSQP